MPGNFSHQINKGKTVNVVGPHTVVQVFGGPETPAENIQPDIKRLFTSLKERYQNRYEQKLDGRFEITLEVSESFDSQNPQKFTERYTKDARVSEAFPTINSAFEKTGRLLIVGSPGIGKTVLLLKLALNLLNRTDLVKQEAFPVIFNLASWSKEYKRFEDWLVTMLVSGYGLSKNFATTLLHQGRIIFLLDGLDELARESGEEAANRERAKCMDSLNDYLQRGRKVVICSRREEFIQMRKRTGQDAPVSAKIEVLDLTEDDIRLALLFAQEDQESRASANNLLKIIETDEVFLEVLRTPFYFTIALEVFDKELWTEKGFPSSKDENEEYPLHFYGYEGSFNSTRIEDIKKYLLQRFIENKLKHSPNPHNFQTEKTKVWLKWLAERLTSSTTFELAALRLTDLYTEDVMKASKIQWTFYGASLLCIILFPLFLSSFEDTYRTHGLLICVVVYFSFQRSSLLRGPFPIYEIPTEDITSFDLRRFLDSDFWMDLIAEILFGSFLGFIYAVLLSITDFVPSFINSFFHPNVKREITVSLIPFGLIVGALTGFFIGIFGSLKKVKELAVLERPYQRLLGGLSSRLFFSTFIILLSLVGMAGYESQLRNGYINPHYGIYITLIVLPLSFAFFILFSLPVIRHFILRLDLYRQDKMPLKYATFLDYAVGLRILEKDGGYWRFRHQNLQEHFVTSVPTPPVQTRKRDVLHNPSQKPTAGQKCLAAFWLLWGQNPSLPFKAKFKRIVGRVFWEGMGMVCLVSTFYTLIFTFSGGENIKDVVELKLGMIAIYFFFQGIEGFCNVLPYLRHPEEEMEITNLSPWNDDTPRGLRYRSRYRLWTSIALLIEILCITGKYYWDSSLKW
jgi:energy-coupling factor transporter ATP-binding protein EcfA2